MPNERVNMGDVCVNVVYTNVCLASSSSAYLLWIRVSNLSLLEPLWDTTKGLWSQIRNEIPPPSCVCGMGGCLGGGGTGGWNQIRR